MSRPEPLIVDELPPALTVKQTERLWSCSVDAIYEAIGTRDPPASCGRARGHRSQRRRAGPRLPTRR